MKAFKENAAHIRCTFSFIRDEAKTKNFIFDAVPQGGWSGENVDKPSSKS